MHLPININNLLHANIVESDRVEFKESWNPEDIIKTICAFSNDFNHYGGGYIIIGIKEIDGSPILPPKGLTKYEIDKIQKELVNICQQIKPHYTPRTSIEKYRDKNIVIISRILHKLS